jgi:Mrp family chromosome partitioning ATPase
MPRRRVAFEATRAEVRPRPADPALAALLVPHGEAFEGFRRLRTRVRALGEERPLRCLGVVGPTAYEGATAVTLGLAAALAQEAERRVLVVEATLRAPSLERTLGLPAAPGLGAWLRADGDGLVALRRLEPWGFDVLAAGEPIAAPGELLGGERMADLLASLRESFDHVLVDCPPLETTADTLTLQDGLDGLLVVVRARHASRDAIRRATAHLRADRVCGVVFNDHTEKLSRWIDRRRARARG